MIKCIICQMEKDDSELDQELLCVCRDCVDTTRRGAALVQVSNDDWIKIAESNDLRLYERQPMETDTEWKLWQAYSGMYPEQKPVLRVAAASIGISASYASVLKNRWDYNVRIQEYKRHIDELTTIERANAVKDMNAKHISMAAKLQGKLDQAIDMIDPGMLKPAELNSLLKTMAELEQKAHLNNDSVQADTKIIIGTKGKDEKDVTTSRDDISEILSILDGSVGGLAGLRGPIGVEKTTTTTTRVMSQH